MATAQRRRHTDDGGTRRCSGSDGRRAVCLAVCLALWLMVSAGAVGSSSARVAAVAGCTVTMTADTGAGSLRQAIIDANGGVCASPITFAIGTGAQTINVAASLPPLTLTTGAGITIDGTTQLGYVAAGAPLITVNRNSGGVTGVALFTVNAGATAHLTALTVQNTATGAIRNAGVLTLADSVLQNNFSGTNGAGIFNNAGTLTVTGSTLAGNQCFGCDGGAIGMIGGTTRVRTSLLTGNIVSGGNGGGITMSGGTLIVDRSTLTANTTPSLGGGIYTRVNGSAAPTLYVTNSTLSGNAAFSGGGIYADSSTVATFTNATITANTTTTNPGDGGGLYFGGTSGTFANTIIAGNSVASGAGPDIRAFSGTITDQGHNVIGKTDGTPAGTFTDPTDYTGTINVPRDPGLAPPPSANNGGPTPTNALLGSSIAVNHGDPTICANTGGVAPVGGIDQRGVHRPQGAACDIGAFEYFQLFLNGGTLPTSGGVVTLTGTGFLPGLTLTIAGTTVPVLAVSSDGTGLTTRVPAHASGIVTASVSEPIAPAPVMASLTYAAFTPVLTAIGPASGGIGGGSTVTLTGLYFAPDASVAVDGVTLPTITVVNDTTITFIAPAHPAVAVVSVSVTVQGLTGTKVNGYTYGIIHATPPPAPTATVIAPVGTPGTAAPTHVPGTITGPVQPQPVRH